MKKSVKIGLNYLVLIAGILIISLTASCGDTTDTMIKGKSYKTEGWINDDTFVVTALGAPAPDAKGLVKRRTQSKEAAIIMAQKMIVEKMIGAQLKGASAVKDGESAGIVVTKEFEGMVKGGSVEKITYDEDDNCEVLYQVEGRGLKKRAALEIEKLNNK
ncbi:MAG: hypothetical protein OEV66_00320 [Spirochaetia bacterium]|nr:hypothetical protein [Spirochaetia bacterium]